VELRDYLRVLRKQWRLIVLCVLLACGAAALVTMNTPPQYQSSVTFFVSTPGEDTSTVFSGGVFSQQRVRSYADIVAGPATAAAVAEGLEGVEADDLEGDITAQAVPDTVLLNATVTAGRPEEALTVARAVGSAVPELLTSLERLDAGTSPIKVTVVEQPELPEGASAPRPARNLALAGVLGLLLGVGLAVAREALDNTVKSPDDVRAATGGPVLGLIAFDSGASKRPLIVQDSPRSARAEAFRQLRTNLQFVSVTGSLKSFVITSSVPKEGKSTTACNLALSLTQAGVRVCLVEGDLRRPRVADYLGLEGAIGLTSVLIRQVTLDDALQPWGDGTLEVLPSGPLPPNPSELIASAGMDELLRSLEQRFDLVLVDAPPLLPVTDGALLAALTDGAVLSVRTRTTRREQLTQATAALQAVDAKVLGVVLNMVPTRGPDAYQAYGYGYGYGSYNSDLKRPQLSPEDAVRAVDASAGTAQQRAPSQSRL